MAAVLLSVALAQALPAQDEAKATSAAGGRGNVQILSDTRGFDFGPYLRDVIPKIRTTWYRFVPEEATAPILRSGTCVIEFRIEKNGEPKAIKVAQSSGSVAMDRAAYDAVRESGQFAPLPREYSGDSLKLQFRFEYNPGKDKPATPEKTPAPADSPGKAETKK